MAWYSLFVLKVPLNPNQPTKSIKKNHFYFYYNFGKYRLIFIIFFH